MLDVDYAQDIRSAFQSTYEEMEEIMDIGSNPKLQTDRSIQRTAKIGERIKKMFEDKETDNPYRLQDIAKQISDTIQSYPPYHSVHSGYSSPEQVRDVLRSYAKEQGTDLVSVAKRISNYANVEYEPDKAYDIFVPSGTDAPSLALAPLKMLNILETYQSMIATIERMPLSDYMVKAPLRFTDGKKLKYAMESFQSLIDYQTSQGDYDNYDDEIFTLSVGQDIQSALQDKSYQDLDRLDTLADEIQSLLDHHIAVDSDMDDIITGKAIQGQREYDAIRRRVDQEMNYGDGVEDIHELDVLDDLEERDSDAWISSLNSSLIQHPHQKYFYASGYVDNLNIDVIIQDYWNVINGACMLDEKVQR